MSRTSVRFLPALAAIFLTVFALPGCRTTSSDTPAPDSEPSSMASLKILVSYRERMLLPPGCTLFVELVNISRLNPDDNVEAKAFLPIKAAPPFKAVFSYDPEKIVKQLHYAISARIEFDGQVLFSGDMRIDPLTWPKDKPVEITVTMVRR